MNNDFFEEIEEERSPKQNQGEPYQGASFSSYNGYQGEPPQRTNGLAIASFVFALLGLLGCCCFPFSIPCAIIAIVLAFLSKKGTRMSGLAKAGLVIGIIAAVLAVLLILYLVVIMNDPSVREYFKIINDYAEELQVNPDATLPADFFENIWSN